MNARLKEHLLTSDINEDVIAILEDQKLTNCKILQEVDISVLIFCGIKAGDAMTIKRSTTFLLSNDDQAILIDESPISYQEISMSSLPSTEHQLVTDTDECTNNVVKSPFLFEEKKNRKYFANFELVDKFSPAVSYALENKCLTGTKRNEFVRDICTNILANGIHYVNKSERDKVALTIVTKYPHLKDSIGSGLGSWTESIKNRFKHIRKYDAKKRRSSETVTSSDTNKQTSSSNCKINPMPKRARKLDFWNKIPQNETTSEGIHADHVRELKKESERPHASQDKVKIKQLMMVTYNKRRSDILTSTIPVHEIVKDFPSLATIVGIRQEFGRIMENEHVMKELKENFSKQHIAIIKYCERKPRKTPFLKEALHLRKEVISQEPERIQEIESTFSVMVIPELLGRKIGKDNPQLIHILNENEDLNTYVRKTKFPCLVGSGDNILKLDNLYLCVEGAVLVDVTAFPTETVFFTLYATYYIFSIVYPPQYADVFTYIDSVLMGLEHTASNKIVLNKFVRELNDLLS